MTQTTSINLGLEILSQRKASYRTRPVEVSVEFADREQIIDTLEGPVVCHLGDAIVTGSRGERWPQPATEFSEKYVPARGQEPNTDGRYTKHIKTNDAAQIHEPFVVELSNERGSLRGKPGDWYVWNGPNDLKVVAREIFSELYEPETVTVYVELGKDLSEEDKRSALQVIHSLDVSLGHTSIVYSEETSDVTSMNPAWFRIVKGIVGDPIVIPSIVEIPISQFTSNGTRSGLTRLLKDASESESILAFTLRKLWHLLSSSASEKTNESIGRIIAWQLAAIDSFNANLKSNWDRKFPFFIEHRDEASESSGLKKAWRIGAIADKLAAESQDKWQGLVFATTKELHKDPLLKRLRNIHRTLVALGLFAAVMLAAFSELGGTCVRSDPWGFDFCASSTWEDWAGPSFFLAYLIALGFAWIGYARAKTGQWEVKHQDYRLLAECIRVLHARTLLGKPSCVASDLPLVEPTDSGWVRLALRSIYFDSKNAGLRTTCEEPIKVAQALKIFVKDQLVYNAETMLKRRKGAIQRLTGASHVALLFFVFVLLVVTANVFCRVIFRQAFLSPMMDHAALICLVLGLGSWGGMRKVLDTFALEQEIQRGNLVMSYLATAERLGTSDAIRLAADYFLQDQAHWHALHRSKPIEAVTGG